MHDHLQDLGLSSENFMQLIPVPNYLQGDEESNPTENKWEFLLDAVDEEACYSLSDILDANLDATRLEEFLFKLINMYPKDIDIMLQMAKYYDNKAQSLLSYIHIQSAVAIALQAIPNEFCWQVGKINYGALNNRPFFRAYSALATRYYEMENIADAITICKRLIALDSKDDIGARFTLAKCYQHIKNSQDLDELCEKYEDENLFKL